MDHAVRLLSTLALKGAVHGLAARYEAAGGAHIDADFAPTLALLDRLRGGEGADVVILTREGLSELVHELPARGVRDADHGCDEHRRRQVQPPDAQRWGGERDGHALDGRR